MAVGDRVLCAVQTGMDQTSAIVQDGMNEVKGAAAPAREILQRFLDAGEIRIEFHLPPWLVVMFPKLTALEAGGITIPIPDKKG